MSDSTVSPTLLLALRELGKTDGKALLKSAVKELIVRRTLELDRLDEQRRWLRSRRRVVLADGPEPMPRERVLAGVAQTVAGAPSEIADGRVVARPRHGRQAPRPPAEGAQANRGGRAAGAGDGRPGRHGGAPGPRDDQAHHSRPDAGGRGVTGTRRGAEKARRPRRHRQCCPWLYAGDDHRHDLDGTFDSAFDSSFDSSFDSAFDSDFSSGDGGGDGGGGGGGGS